MASITEILTKNVYTMCNKAVDQSTLVSNSTQTKLKYLTSYPRPDLLMRASIKQLASTKQDILLLLLAGCHLFDLPNFVTVFESSLLSCYRKNEDQLNKIQ